MPNNDAMRVFYIEPVGGHRGMHYYDVELCQALRAAGPDVTWLTCDETRQSEVPASLKVEYPFQGIYGDTSKAIRGLRYLRALIRISFAARRRRVTLAHFHYFHFPPLDYLYFKWLRLLGMRLIVTAHDIVPFTAREPDLVWLRRLYHAADRIIVHAESNREAMVQTFDVALEKIHVIPMGPYLHFAQAHSLSKSSARRRLGLDPDDPVVLFFGQIKRVKGVQHLIRAFRRVVDECPAVQLVIAGPEWKHLFAEYAGLIEELRLGDRVYTRIEYIPDEEVGVYYSAADVVALPYTEAYQSAVLYMAYSFGKPVVASAVGGLAEVVEDGVTGLLVPPADPSTLADCLISLLHNPPQMESMGEQGKRMVESKFNWAGIARRTMQAYAGAMEKTG